MDNVMSNQSNLVTNGQNPYIGIDGVLNRKKGQLFLKRAFDIVVSLIGLIILSPIFLVISIMIKLDLSGPIFFKQTRVGKDGREFKIYKFRTMVQDAEKLGMQITVGEDCRVTRVGRFIRKTKLDELPQLINVFIGDMSLVGPRPEVPKYVAMYDEVQKNILKVRPGITDYASIEFRDENELLAESNDPEEMYIKEIMPTKFALNVKYLNDISILKDIKIIFKTLYKVLR